MKGCYLTSIVAALKNIRYLKGSQPTVGNWSHQYCLSFWRRTTPGACLSNLSSSLSEEKKKEKNTAMENNGKNDGSEDVRSRKQALRRQVRSRLRQLSSEDIAQQSRQVWERLFDMPAYQNARSIGLFLSMPRGEIDTNLVFQHAVHAGMEIYVPQVGKNFEKSDMELLKVIHTTELPQAHDDTNNNDNGNTNGVGPSRVEDDEDASATTMLFHHSWPRNKWGIPEPPPDMPVEPAKPGDIDLLIVPGLAFDKHGNRCGQGKGYYDRFIARMKENVSAPTLIGVGLLPQLVDEEIPVDTYDQRMDMVLMPHLVIE